MSDYVNTTPEEFDDKDEMSREDILMSESDLLRGLIEAGKEKDNKDYYEKIQIRRAGKLYFEFRIRPLTDSEVMWCRERATKYAPKKRNQPKQEIDFKPERMRSLLIYTATVDEDRAKLWDNKQAQNELGVLEGADMIDSVLFVGEKISIIDRIDEISGYNNDLDDIAKN